jgi:hypothetical protein
MRKGIDTPLWVTIHPLHDFHGQGPKVAVTLYYTEPGVTGDGTPVQREESEDFVYPDLGTAIAEASQILREHWPNSWRAEGA